MSERDHIKGGEMLARQEADGRVTELHDEIMGLAERHRNME